MNAEEIYKKYIAPEPEPEPVPSEPTISVKNEGMWDPVFTGLLTAASPAGRPYITASEFNNQYNSYTPPTPMSFSVDDVQINRDNLTCRCHVKLLCSLGGRHFAYEHEMDHYMLKDTARPCDVIDMLTQDAIKEITMSLAKHYDMKTIIGEALYKSTLIPSKPIPIGLDRQIDIKNPHPMLNPDAV